MKKKLIILAILIFSGFIWAKCIKQGKYVYVDDHKDDYIVDASEYVESGEYYFNCYEGFFVKRVPPELDMERLKEGKILIRDSSSTIRALKNYMSRPGWENDFEYAYTDISPKIHGNYPEKHYFYKFVNIDGEDYCIKIVQAIQLHRSLYISIWKGHRDSLSTIKGNSLLEAIEKAKSSCPDPQ